jgi:hypothetical protein
VIPFLERVISSNLSSFPALVIPRRSRGTLRLLAVAKRPINTRSFDCENGLASESILSAQDDRHVGSSASLSDGRWLLYRFKY